MKRRDIVAAVVDAALASSELFEEEFPSGKPTDAQIDEAYRRDSRGKVWAADRDMRHLYAMVFRASV